MKMADGRENTWHEDMKDVDMKKDPTKIMDYAHEWRQMNTPAVRQPGLAWKEI